MNLMSSMAKTFVGSDIAIVSVAPVLLTGRTPYFRATSPGTTLMIAGSISKCARSIEGTPNCWDRVSVMSCSDTAPIRIRASPNLPLSPLGQQSGIHLLGRHELRLDEEISEFYRHWEVIQGKAL